VTQAQVIRLYKKYFKYWRHWFGLSDWKINTTYHTYLHAGRSGNNVAATSNASWEYMDADIQVNLAVCSDFTEDEIEKVVIHELLHLVVNEMREDDIKHEEKVVSMLSNIIWWVKSQAKD